jgi:toxin ParE1/3/4
MPGLGEPHESSNPRLAGLRVGRVEGFEKYLIFYRHVGDSMEIVRVLHGARDIDRVLGSEDAN